MTIHVNIAEAKARLSELVAAAVRGEEVILSRAGRPQARIQPISDARIEEQARIAAQRKAAIGMFAEEFKGYDLSVEALKRDRGDPDERYNRKFGPAA